MLLQSQKTRNSFGNGGKAFNRPQIPTRNFFAKEQNGNVFPRMIGGRGRRVTAVIRGDDHRVFIPELLHDAMGIFDRNAYATQIFLAHPAVVVTALFVGLHHI